MEARKMTLEELEHVTHGALKDNAEKHEKENAELKKRITHLEIDINELKEDNQRLRNDLDDKHSLISAMSRRMAGKDAEINFYREIISEKFKQEAKNNE